jgi:hypothetical protein
MNSDQVRKTLSLLHQFFSIFGEVRVNPKSLKVDIDGNVRLKPDARTNRFPISFGQVRGDFDCGGNELTTLVGSPRSCITFACGGNQLTDLVGGPQEVSEAYYCDRNQLTSLDGAPQVVPKSFWCQQNNLTSLVHGPTEVGGNFFVQDNPLENLDGAPKQIKSTFVLTYDTKLPLLKLLHYKDLSIMDAPNAIYTIISKYAGTGKRGMLGAGVELAKAGFKDNARW